MINDSLHKISKKIDWPILINHRISYDSSKEFSWNENYFLTEIIHWDLTEQSARAIVYADYYARFYRKNTPLSIFIDPYTSVLTGQYSSPSSSLSLHQNIYNNVKRDISCLGISAELHHPLLQSTLSAINSCDSVLHKKHRIWLRSDVVYYNIKTWKVVSEHRIVSSLKEDKLYTIRFFLNSTKDILLWTFEHPIYLFGCVAILVNPHDKRYKKVRGKEIILPITNKQVPIISYEWVSIEWNGTRLLVPAHNRDDFQIALSLWLPTDVYAFDSYGIFTKEAKDFAWKSLEEFSDNVIKYIDDISNLDQVKTIQVTEYRDKIDNVKLFPILRKNIYIGLGYHSLWDDDFVRHYVEHGSSQELINDIQLDEFFCISNQDLNQPIMSSLWWYIDSEFWTVDQGETNLLQDIIYDFFFFWLLRFPAKWDEIVDVFSLQFDGSFIWESFYDYHVNYTTKSYTNIEDIHICLERLTDKNVSISDINAVLIYIDMNNHFLHTKHGYILTERYDYHYDSEYVWLSVLLSNILEKSYLHIFYTLGEHKRIKYLLYLYSYLYDRPLIVDFFALHPVNILHEQRNEIRKWWAADEIRLFLLQYTILLPQEEIPHYYTLDQLGRFIQKWWNISRIIPIYKGLSLWELKDKIVAQNEYMNEYDPYFLSKIYELYDEVIFLQSKNYTSQVVHLVIHTLWIEIMDLLIYVLKKVPSPVTPLIAAYVVLFMNHVLYPLAPTMSLWLLSSLWYTLEPDFFIRDMPIFFEKHYKCNLMMHILVVWFQKTLSSDTISWFALQANRDFLEYFKNNYENFHSFIWEEYQITYYEEWDIRPEYIEWHKIFTMQRGLIERKEVILQSLPSLSSLQWQLQYKQQLLQTMKNTIVRMRSLGQADKTSHFQWEIDILLKDITDIEYQISKLRYFQ